MDRDTIIDIVKEIQGIAYDVEVMPLFDVLERFNEWEDSRVLKRLKDIREKIQRTQAQQAEKNEEQFTRDFVEIGANGALDGSKVLLVRFLTSISKAQFDMDEHRTRYTLVVNDDPDGRVLLKNFNVQYTSRSLRDKEYDRLKKVLGQKTNIRFL